MRNRNSIRTLIVDDEPLARESIRILVQDDPEIDVVGECADGASALEAIQELAPDLLFLDVQMPEMDGLQVLETVGPERMPVVVFITAYDRYAVKAFEHHALDYLVKPFADERFHEMLRRSKVHIRREQLDDLSLRMAALLEERRPAVPAAPARSAPDSAGMTRVALKSRERITLLPVDEIDWIEAADYCVRIHSSGKSHLLRETLGSMESRLDPMRFYRVHRSAIVNLERIRELQPWFRGQYLIILHDGTQITLSRSRREGLAALLGHTL